MRLSTWLFPQTAPIVVSRILRVHGSSGHKPGSKNLQNKLSIDGGVPVGSPMLKLDKEMESKKNVSLAALYFSHTFLLAFLPFFFMKKDNPPLSMGRSTFYGKWAIGFQNGREASASPALQSFFLLGNQVAQVFRLKDWLIILRVVSYEVCGRISS